MKSINSNVLARLTGRNVLYVEVTIATVTLFWEQTAMTLALKASRIYTDPDPVQIFGFHIIPRCGGSLVISL